MVSNMVSLKILTLLSISLFLILLPQIIISDDGKQPDNCMDKAVARILEIRSLPEKTHLHTLDDQKVLLKDFYDKCYYLFPQCCLCRKFYYWKNEIKEMISSTENGMVKHKIRCYHNCLSCFCKDHCDSKKTHGDVAEFYDSKGDFMGLAVYMGNGKYCSLPHDDYEK